MRGPIIPALVELGIRTRAKDLVTEINERQPSALLWRWQTTSAKKRIHEQQIASMATIVAAHVECTDFIRSTTRAKGLREIADERRIATSRQARKPVRAVRRPDIGDSATDLGVLEAQRHFFASESVSAYLSLLWLGYTATSYRLQWVIPPILFSQKLSARDAATVRRLTYAIRKRVVRIRASTPEKVAADLFRVVALGAKCAPVDLSAYQPR